MFYWFCTLRLTFIITLNARISAPAQLAVSARISTPLKSFFSNKHPAQLTAPARISAPPLTHFYDFSFSNK